MLWNKAASASSARSLPTFVSSSVNRVNSATLTLTAPTGIQDGDLLVAVATVQNSLITITPPAGFTTVFMDASTSPPNGLFTKIASSETGNYVFNISSSTGFAVAMLVYRNATRVNTRGSVTIAASSTGIAPSITPTYRGVLVGVFAQRTTSDVVITTPPAGMTERAATSTASTLRPILYAYDVVQSATSTGSKSAVWSASADVASYLFQVTNEPTVGPEFVASANRQTTSSGLTLTIDKPTGTIEGDLMVAVVSLATNGTWTGDTGWTEVADQGTNPSLRIAYKVAGASEGSTYTFTASSSDTMVGVILTYRYASYDTVGTFVTGANPLVLTSITPSQSQSVLLAAGARDAISITLGTPTGMTARFTDNDATFPSFIVCDQTVTKGPTGTRSMSTGSTTTVGGILFSIKPTRSL